MTPPLSRFPLLEACSDNFNNPILLINRHFIITWQAHTTSKDICSNIFYSTGNIRIGTTPDTSLTSNTLMHSVHRLHMHGLPDRPSFSIDGGYRFQYLSRTGLSFLRSVAYIYFPSHLLAHSILIYDECTQPVVRFSTFGDRIHLDWQTS